LYTYISIKNKVEIGQLYVEHELKNKSIETRRENRTYQNLRGLSP